MQGAVILYIAVFADGDMVQVAADDGAIPHAGAFGQGNIAEDGGIGCDKRGFLGIGVLFSQGFDHGGGPPVWFVGMGKSGAARPPAGRSGEAGTGGEAAEPAAGYGQEQRPINCGYCSILRDSSQTKGKQAAKFSEKRGQKGIAKAIFFCYTI